MCKMCIHVMSVLCEKSAAIVTLSHTFIVSLHSVHLLYNIPFIIIPLSPTTYSVKMKVHTLTKKSFIEDIKMDLVAAAVSSL